MTVVLLFNLIILVVPPGEINKILDANASLPLRQEFFMLLVFDLLISLIVPTCYASAR